MGSVVDAGFEATGVAKYALLEPAADINALEQIFIITSYTTDTGTTIASSTLTDATTDATHRCHHRRLCRNHGGDHHPVRPAMAEEQKKKRPKFQGRSEDPLRPSAPPQAPQRQRLRPVAGGHRGQDPGKSGRIPAG